MADEVAQRTDGDGAVWRPALSGLCACLIGIGLARFAYTPLIPALIEAEWFTASQAFYLGAANLAGYLAGALLAAPMEAWRSPVAMLRIMMLIATVSFFACAFPLSFLWFFLWRFLSGYAGGALMVLAASTVLSAVPRSRRGLAGGVIFTGVGLGIIASGTLVPLVLQAGLVEIWFTLGFLALALTVFAWRGWPAGAAIPAATISRSVLERASGFPLRALYVSYGLNAVGLVAHMVFLVDFVARGRGAGLETASWYWIVFGAGALIGAALSGRLADRIGFPWALRATVLLQALAVSLVAVTDSSGWLVVSSFVVGASVPGVVPLVAGRVHELVPDRAELHRKAWGIATTAFAIGQAAAGYGFSYLFTQTGGSYVALFAVGAAALWLALILEFAAALVARPGRS
jgi:predicted MFS family arabinose efflux permease